MTKAFRRAAAALALLCLAACSMSAGAAKEDMDYRDDAYPEASGTAGLYDEEAKATQSTETASVNTDEKLVYTADLTIESLHYTDTVKAVRDHVRAYGGYIVYENEYVSGYSWKNEEMPGIMHMSLTVRVPSGKFQAFLDEMEGTGKVISRSTNTANITRQYNDTSVQIEALKKQEERLLEMMDKAETIEDMIKVETRLTEVQTDLNLLMTRKQSMDTDVEYSTVTMMIDEVREYTEVHEDFFGRMGQEFVKGWKGFGRLTEDIAAGILYLSPYIVILLAALLIVRKTHAADGWTKKIRLPFRRNNAPKENDPE